MTFYTFTADTNWLRSSDCHILLVHHSNDSCVGCRSSITSFYFFPIALISIANWRGWELITVEPIRNKPVSCSSSSYSLKLSGFKAFCMCSGAFSYQSSLLIKLFGHCGEHWANERCANQWKPAEHLKTLLPHRQNAVSCTLPGWQEQAETHLSIRTHFIPIQTCIIRLAGRRAFLLQVLNSLTAALNRNAVSTLGCFSYRE